MGDSADYTKKIDILSQSLVRVATHPTYGTATRGLGIEVIGSAETKTILEVTGKGIIYGGNIKLASAESKASLAVVASVDGAGVFNNSFDGLNDWNLNKIHVSFGYLLLFDDTAFNYAMGVGFGYTFDESFKVEVVNNAGLSVTGTADIWYATV